MRKLSLAVNISGGYGGDNVYRSERLIAGYTANDEQLAALSMPLQKIAAGAVLEGLAFIDHKQADIKEGKTDKGYSVKVCINTTADGSNYKDTTVAEIEMAGKFYLIERTHYETVAVGMEKLEEAVCGMVYDLLVANELAAPLTPMVAGDEAAEIALLLSKSHYANDVADQIGRAISAAEDAESRVVAARLKLREVMAEVNGAAPKEAAPDVI